MTTTAACPRCSMGVIDMTSPWVDGRRICTACFAKATDGAYPRIRYWNRDGQEVPAPLAKIGDPLPTIAYTMTEAQLELKIPAAALANLSNDDHTRILDMINAWILRHKPPVLKVKT